MIKALLTIFGLCAAVVAPGGAEHFVFFNRDRERITEPSFLNAKAIAGAQIKYTWRELEPEKDAYNFRSIRDDLRVLKAHRKKLFIQLQEASFDPKIILIPRYLLDEPEYHGGADKQFSTPDDDDSRAVPEGWVARRWDKAVQGRFEKLLVALGREFDGEIEGINLPETSVGFGESGKLYPKGFTPEIYRDAVVTNMAALKRAFRKSVAMQYANFMPGEWLPGNDRGLLRGVYESAAELKVGVGGPDLLPGKPGQMNHSYPLIRGSAGMIPTGISVQDGNYEHKNPKTGKVVTMEELIEFATEHLRVDYVFWCMQEPYYFGAVIPYFARQ